ncbi:MAG: acyltransferase family protein [Bacteroidales bacterium]|nr:acyltransferase family protein [Candidatus Physcousia equi]
MRIIEFDILKGFAIFAVIYTHCMQYLFDSSFDNPLYNFIYSFHMPLFMIVSGILSFRKIYDRGKQSLPIKRLPLLIPAFVFGGLLMGGGIIVGKTVSLSDVLQLPFTFWFLSALFVCTCVYWMASLICRSQLINLLVLSGVSLLLPIGEYNKFMMPFIGIGLCLAQYGIVDRMRKINMFWICLFGMLIGAAYLWLWDSDYTIYKTTCPSIAIHENEQIIAYLLRIVFGLCFTLTLLALTFRLKLKNSMIAILSYLSRNSLELYVLHLFIFILSFASGFTLRNIANDTISVVSLSLIASVLLTALLSLVLKMIGRTKYLSFILFGKKIS